MANGPLEDVFPGLPRGSAGQGFDPRLPEEIEQEGKGWQWPSGEAPGAWAQVDIPLPESRIPLATPQQALGQMVLEPPAAPAAQPQMSPDVVQAMMVPQLAQERGRTALAREGWYQRDPEFWHQALAQRGMDPSAVLPAIPEQVAAMQQVPTVEPIPREYVGSRMGPGGVLEITSRDITPSGETQEYRDVYPPGKYPTEEEMRERFGEMPVPTARETELIRRGEKAAREAAALINYFEEAYAEPTGQIAER